MNNNIKILLFSIILLAILVSTFALIFSFKSEEKSNKITIITTLFPTYDFAKNIAGDKANIKLLISPGTDSHSYELSISDIAEISNSTLFAYTGSDLEPWTETIVSSLSNKINILNVANNVNIYDNLDQDEDLKYDPHIWMSIKNAKIMCENIYNALCDIDKNNIEIYSKNYENYIAKLNDLENKYENINKLSSNQKLVFASPFSYQYLIKDYNLEYISAYGSCTEETDPSVADMKKIIDYLNSNQKKYILCDKLFSKSTAQTIAKETQATILDFNSIHNLSKEDLQNSKGYVELMNENLNNILTIIN